MKRPTINRPTHLANARMPIKHQPSGAVLPRPEFFRLPKSGERDPHFGLARSFYYAAEANGQLKLMRLKKRGNQRGVTLIPYAAILEMLSTEMESSETAVEQSQPYYV